MEQNLHTPEIYDFRKYDHLWQRVAPELEPYPTPRRDGAAAAASAPQPMTQPLVQQVQQPVMQPPAPQQTVQPPQQMMAAAQPSAALANLPGAEENPCCMGTEAGEMLDVLTGFVEEGLGDQRQLQALARQAPAWARQRLREMAAAEGDRARRLMAVYYLITGQCYRPSVSIQRTAVGNWCAALRERYHAAACNGLNYARAADSTTDLCLTRLLEELSAEAYRQADALLAMLEKSLRP